jgi:hypothetical protein
VPIGGPHRALVNALWPREVKGIPFPVPGAGIGKFLQGKLGPGVRTLLDQTRGTDYFGFKLDRPGASFHENLLRRVAYEFETLAPLTIGAAVGGVRLGETVGEIVQNVLTQVGGSPDIQRNSVLNVEAQRLFPGNNFGDIEEPYQRDLITGGDRIAPDLLRSRKRNKIFRPDSVQAMWAHFDEIDEQLAEKLEALASNLGKRVNGISYTRSHVVTEYFTLVAGARDKKEGAQLPYPQHEFEPTDPNDPDPNKAALAQWYLALEHESVGLDTGSPNTAALTKIRKDLIAEWGVGSEVDKYVLRNTNRRVIPENLLRILPYATKQRYKASADAREAHMLLIGVGNR